MLLATAVFINCVNGVNGDNPTEITRFDVDAIVRTLVTANAKKISEVIEGENRFGTGPVRQAYFAMSHANMISQYEAVFGFIPTAQYSSQMNILSAEWGSISNLRFLISSLGSISAAASGLGNDVYNIFCCGQESYACVDLDGTTANFIYRPLGYGDDPLMLRQSAGFKFASAERILNDAWVLCLRATLA